MPVAGVETRQQHTADKRLSITALFTPALAPRAGKVGTGSFSFVMSSIAAGVLIPTTDAGHRAAATAVGELLHRSWRAAGYS